MKYKAGDKVVIRKDLIEDETYGCDSVVEDMLEFLGKIVTITGTECNGFGFEEYNIKEDRQYWGWTDEMIEGLAPVEEA